MIRVLHVTSELDGGGVDRLLYDYCIRMKDNFAFDFLVNSTNEGILEKPLKNEGFNIFRTKQLRQSLLGSIKDTFEILKNGKYDIVHIHSGYKAVIVLVVSLIVGVKVRISHSHQAYIPEKLRTKVLRKAITPFTKVLSTHLFACGEDAGKWMWGKTSFTLGKVSIMRNAIETDKFRFSDEIRKKVRENLGIEDNFVICNVARFSYQKNHEFLIRIFNEIKKIRKNSKLILIGRGELEDDVKKQVSQFGLEESVLFLGVRNDVPELLNGMDLFLLPSRFEGLPVTLVEVQANGLKSIVSDNITKEIGITDIIKYINLSEKSWVNEVSNSRIISNIDRENYSKFVKTNGYDIDIEARELTRKYESFVLKSMK